MLNEVLKICIKWCKNADVKTDVKQEIKKLVAISRAILGTESNFCFFSALFWALQHLGVKQADISCNWVVFAIGVQGG